MSNKKPTVTKPETKAPQYSEWGHNYSDQWGVIAGHLPITQLGALKQSTKTIRHAVMRAAPKYEECYHKAVAFHAIEAPSLNDFFGYIANMSPTDFVFQHACIRPYVDDRAFTELVLRAVKYASDSRESYKRLLEAMFLSDAATIEVTQQTDPEAYYVTVGWGCRPDHDPNLTLNQTNVMEPTLSNAKARLDFEFQIGNINGPIEVEFSIFEVAESGAIVPAILDSKQLKTRFVHFTQDEKSIRAAQQAGENGDAPLTACSVVGKNFKDLSNEQYKAVRYAYDKNMHRAAATLNTPHLYETALRAATIQFTKDLNVPNNVLSLADWPDLRKIVASVVHLLAFTGSIPEIDPYLLFCQEHFLHNPREPDTYQKNMCKIITVCCCPKQKSRIGVFDAAC